MSVTDRRHCLICGTWWPLEDEDTPRECPYCQEHGTTVLGERNMTVPDQPIEHHPQVAAAYRMADTYKKLAADSLDAQWAEYFDGFAEDLRSALDRAGQLRPADLAAEDLRANVLAIHTPAQIWTDEVIDAETGESEQHALYDDDQVEAGIYIEGQLVATTEFYTVCTECAPRMAVSWPCPTARAVGVQTEEER